MIPYFRWIFSDLVLHKRFTILFIFNLTLGLTGFVALDSFRHLLDASLEMRSRRILGADLGLSSRHPITNEQDRGARKVIGDVPSSRITETYSMVASSTGESRLVQIKGIQRNFPFYGTIHLTDQGPQNPQKGYYDITNEKKVWVYPELLAQLNIKVGEIIKIGSQSFVVSDTVQDDSAAGLTTLMAPRVYMGLPFLKKTGLVSPQSLAWYTLVYKNPLNPMDLGKTIQRIFKLPEIDESVRVFSHRTVSAQMSRMLTYLSDYLGLVSIAAFFLASIGALFLFRSYVQSKIKEVAIFQTLGMTFKRSLAIYFWQLLALGGAASVLTFLFALGLTPWLAQLMSGLVAVPIDFQFRWQSFFVAGLLGLGGSLLIGLPLLVKLKGRKPALLFQAHSISFKENSWSYVLHSTAFLTLWGLSVWQAKSWWVGTGFLFGFALCGLVLGGVTYLAIFVFDRFGARWPLILRMAIRNLARQPKSSIPCFLALGMGVILLNVVPQVEGSLQAELENPEVSKLPSFFLFDIQDSQVEGLGKIVKEEGHSLGQVSPMIRGRLLEVNDKPFEKKNGNGQIFSREEQQEARFRNRGFNLSYRSRLDVSEKIVEGRTFSGVFDSESKMPAEISVEQRFAQRLNLKLGDRLLFEVQGVPIASQIVNLRSVRWMSFRPNFFVQFQPGVLEMAPKTFIATIGDLSAEKKIEIQNKIVKAIPNISLVDVSRIVQRLSEVSRQMSTALQFMALLCLLVGLLVMYSIASHQAFQRRKDINLLKVLGASQSTLTHLFVLEFAVLAGLAGGVGIFLSIGLSYGISTVVFDSIWAWSAYVPVVTFLSLIVLVSILALFSVFKVIRARPSFYL